MKENKNVIKLNEEQLRNIVSETVMAVLNEASDMDEGFFDNLKSAWSGAKQGYNYQKAVDAGTDGFKQEHDYEDARNDMMNPLSKSKNTAVEQANELFRQAAEYRKKANKLYAMANAISKRYALAKDGFGKRVATVKPEQAPITAMSQGQGQRYKSNTVNRNDITNGLGQPLK